MIGNHYYDVLGLPFGASEQLIKKRYKELAKKYHPDRNPSPDANKRFIEINEAYIYLLSKDKIPAKSFEEQQKEKVEVCARKENKGRGRITSFLPFPAPRLVVDCF